MHQVQLQLSDQVYEQMKLRADEAGFRSVDEYVTDIITTDTEEEVENIDHLFTPERLAYIDKIYAEVTAGAPMYSMEEVSEYIDAKRADWIRDNER